MRRVALTALAALAALALTAVLATPLDAAACGAFTPPVSESDTAEVSMKAQKALVHIREQSIDVHLQVTATTQLDAFAWYFPVPEGAQLAEGDPDLFADMAGYIQPSVTLNYPQPDDTGGGIGCGAAGSTEGRVGELDSQMPVTVVDAGRIGDYSYEIVDAESASDLVDWLETNDYQTPAGSRPLLQDYIDMGMDFAAVKIAADVEELDREPDTIIISAPREADAVLYPLLLSSLSAPSVSEVLIYTLADGRYLADAPFMNAELQDVADEMAAVHNASGEATYEEGFDQLTDANEGRLAVTEYAVDLEQTYRCDEGTPCPDSLQSLLDSGSQSYLTRLHLRVPAGKLADLELYPSDNSATAPANASALLGQTAESAVLPILIVLLVAGAARRR